MQIQMSVRGKAMFWLLLGFGLSLVIVSRIWLPRRGWVVVASCTAMGFLAGLFGGEQGVNWLGRMIRDREQR